MLNEVSYFFFARVRIIDTLVPFCVIGNSKEFPITQKTATLSPVWRLLIFMRHRGFEPRTTWLKVKCSTDWANTPYAQNRNRTSDTRIFSPLLYQLSYLGILDLNFHSDLSSGDRIWTYDLRVMSPTSFQTAPPRDIMLYMICFPFQKYSWKRKWMEVDSNHRSKLQQIYSLSPLATRESIHMELYSIKPMIGLEPITCWLQISCSANWATSA